MWSVNIDILEAQSALGGKGNEPFIRLLDPAGRDSEIYKEIENYFYYAQLRTQGEDCTRYRIIEKKIGISEVSSIMQAMGYYPSEQDIEDIKNEIKYSKVLETGEYIESIEFEDLIRVYLNHKPAEELTKKEIEKALLCTRQFEMPGMESSDEDEDDHDVYYLGKNENEEYLENFKFKEGEGEEDEEGQAEKTKNGEKATKGPTNAKTTAAKANGVSHNSGGSGSSSSSSSRISRSSSSSNSNKAINRENGDGSEPKKKNGSEEGEEGRGEEEEVNSSVAAGTTSKMLNKNLDTEERYEEMRAREAERKRKLEKARKRKEYLKNRDFGKFSKSALLSMLQQYGESLSAEVFDQYLEALLENSHLKYNQLPEFFTLDEFVNEVLSFESEEALDLANTEN